MAKLKVYGGTVFNGVEGQLRVVVAVTSKKRAAEILGESLHYINTWWMVTGNPEEVEAALSDPEMVFARGLDAKNTPYVKRPDLKSS
jgi:hypothetical protein